MKVSLALISAASALVPWIAGRRGGPATASASAPPASASGSTTIEVEIASDLSVNQDDPLVCSSGDQSAWTADELALSTTGVVTTASPTSSGSVWGASAAATNVDAKAEDSSKAEGPSDVPLPASAEGFSASVKTVDGGSLEGRDHGTTKVASDMESSGLRVNDSMKLALMYQNLNQKYPQDRANLEALANHVTESLFGVARDLLGWCGSFPMPFVIQELCEEHQNLAIRQYCRWSLHDLLLAARKARRLSGAEGDQVGNGSDHIMIALCEANRGKVGKAEAAVTDDHGGATTLLRTSRHSSQGSGALDDGRLRLGASAAGPHAEREKPAAPDDRRESLAEASRRSLRDSIPSTVPVKQDSPVAPVSGDRPGLQPEAAKHPGGPTFQAEQAKPETPSSGFAFMKDEPGSTYWMYDTMHYIVFVGVATLASIWVARPFFLNDDRDPWKLKCYVADAIVGIGVAYCRVSKGVLFPFSIRAIGFGYALGSALTFPKLLPEGRKMVMYCLITVVGIFGIVVVFAYSEWSLLVVCVYVGVNGMVACEMYDWLYNRMGWRFLVVLAASCFVWFGVCLSSLRVEDPSVGLAVDSAISFMVHLSVVAFLMRALMHGAWSLLKVRAEIPGWAKKWVPEPVAYFLGFYVPAQDGQEGRIAGCGEAGNTNAGAADPVLPQANPHPPPPPPPTPRPPTSASSQGRTTQQTTTEGDGTRLHPNSNQATRAQVFVTHSGNTDARPIQAASQQGTKDPPAPQGRGTSTGTTGISTHAASTATTQQGTKDPPAPQGQGSSTGNTTNSTQEASTQPSTNDRPVLDESVWSEHKHNGRTFLYNPKTEESQWKDERQEETAEVPADAGEVRTNDDRTSTEAAQASNESDHDQEDSKPSASNGNQAKAAVLHITDDMSGDAIANALGYAGGNASSPGSF